MPTVPFLLALGTQRCIGGGRLLRSREQIRNLTRVLLGAHIIAFVAPRRSTILICVQEIGLQPDGLAAIGHGLIELE